MMQRSYQRTNDQARPIRVEYSIFDYADGSVMLELGRTRVICGVTLSQGVPQFLKGKGQGWLTASYSLLPHSTKTRTERESAGKRHDRSIEIARLIGRVFRTVIDLAQLGERTIHVDCDVVQADGGTRTACITAASFAVHQAQEKWLSQKMISAPVMKERIAALSAGIVGQVCLVDLDFAEDSIIDADFNFVFTRSGKLLEVQGTAEKQPIGWEQIAQMKNATWQAVEPLFGDQITVSSPALLMPVREQIV